MWNVHERGVPCCTGVVMIEGRQSAPITRESWTLRETSFYGQVHGCPIIVPRGSSVQLMDDRIVCSCSGNVIACPSHRPMSRKICYYHHYYYYHV